MRYIGFTNYGAVLNIAAIHASIKTRDDISTVTQIKEVEMGAWGYGSFENDGAGDLAADLVHGHDIGCVTKAFSVVLDNDDYIEVYEAQRAIAAGEVVALILGHPLSPSQIPKKILDWLDIHSIIVETKLTEDAIQAVEKVYRRSEMRELWEEVDDYPRWQAAVLDLVTRLRNDFPV